MNELYRFLTLAVTNEWRRLPAEERDGQKREFAAALRESGTRAHAYSFVGTRADADLLLWLIADELEELQRFESRLAATSLWAWSTRPYGYLAARQRSKYLAGHEHGDSEHVRAEPGPRGDKPYLVVYPMVKRRDWYALPLPERTKMMAEHFATGHRYPGVRINTAYSFGIDDQEFVVTFEVDDPREFLALVADLRESRASQYTLRETPIFTAIAEPIERALDLIDGAAVRQPLLR